MKLQLTSDQTIPEEVDLKDLVLEEIFLSFSH